MIQIIILIPFVVKNRSFYSIFLNAYVLHATLQENYMLYKYIITAAKPVIERVEVFLLYNHKDNIY